MKRKWAKQTRRRMARRLGRTGSGQVKEHGASEAVQDPAQSRYRETEETAKTIRTETFLGKGSAMTTAGLV